MSAFLNLTPHAIVVCGGDKKPIRTIQPSGYVARVKTERKMVDVIDLIPLFRTQFGDVSILSPDGTDVVSTDGIEALRGHWIVSSIVLSAWVSSGDPRAEDAYVPGEAVRDEAGRVIGCIGLTQ